MLVLGLVLVLASGALIAAVVLSNTDPATVSAFGESTDALSLGGVFGAGAVAGAVLLLGLVLLPGAAARRRRARKERKHLARENAQLRDQLRDDTVVDAGDPYPEETSRKGRHSVS